MDHERDQKNGSYMGKANKGNCFAVIDSGSHEMAAIAAHWNNNGDYDVEGFARADSRGIKKGIVTDIPMATDSVAALLGKLSERTGKPIREVYASVSSPSVGIIPSEGSMLLSKYGREVTERDMDDCIEVGAALKLPLDVEPLHKIVKDFRLDSEKGIKNPLNLDGVKLGVELNVVTISSSVVRNMSRCISEAGFLPSGFVFSGLALAYRMLSDEDRLKGTLLLDVSADLTGAMIYHGGILGGCKAFSLGVEDLLTQDGKVEESKADMLTSRIMSVSGWDKVVSVLVAGDGARHDNLMESLEKMFNKPVKGANCIIKPFEEFPAEAIVYAGGLGVLDHLQQARRKENISKNAMMRWYNRATRFVEKYF